MVDREVRGKEGYVVGLGGEVCVVDLGGEVHIPLFSPCLPS